MVTKEEWVPPFPVSWKDVTETEQADLLEQEGLPEDMWVDPAEMDYPDEDDCSGN